ncbi:MAG: hypothetical protein K0R00_836 [Herbinix sp.]|jgi:hypothetical protein|nr:hypothetical protein [Herbinix sp.]
MKEYVKKQSKTILIVLLLICLVALYINWSEKEAMQKRVDEVFTNTISRAMTGAAMDYRKLSVDEKIQYYYQMFYQLRDAQDIFHSTTYKENDKLYSAIDQLYIYLLEKRYEGNEYYEIEDAGYIYKFFARVLVFPEESESIDEFNAFIANKRKELKS